MDNKEIARRFKLLGQLMDLHGENPFKVRATDSAAIKIKKLPFPIASKPLEELATLPGIGKSTALKIRELVETGELAELNSLLALTPEGVLAMMKAKGIGPKKAAAFWKESGIDNLGALWYACKENKVAKLKGFGLKTQQEIQNIVEFTIENEGKFRLADALELANQIFEELKNQAPNPRLLSFTGAFRRKVEVLDRIDFLICQDKENLLSFLNTNEHFTQLKEEANTVEALYKKQFSIRIHLCEEVSFYARLLETSAEEKHLKELKNLLNGEIPFLSSEEEIYEESGLSFISPLRREGLNEIEQAKQGELHPLIEALDLKGSLHNHSTWSDGTNSIEEMALYCRDVLKLDYFGISDHSKTAVYANGLKVEAVYKQWEEIDDLNHKLAPFRIFKGIESDILSNGSLDYPEELLNKFDFVISSIHSQLGMDEKKATARLIKAIENPYTTILGHPTARQLLIRNGYPINHKKIIDACAANGVVIEINSNPLRLDIDWRWIPYCLEKGVKLSINPDGHALSELHYTDFGVIMAQKGGLTAVDCLNCLSLDEIDQYFKGRKSNIISKFGHD